ncbi:MAG: hypothetical protein KAI47_04400 [Deltaproteobacteria bacterium]|nr:hypothetical protein [Deltaproteobacteria bacterium]
MRSFVVLLVVASVSLAPLWQANAYVSSTTNTSHKALGWSGSNCIFLRVNSEGSDDIQDGSDVAAVHRAIKRWHDVTSCSYLRFNILDDTKTATATFNQKGPNENTVNWVEKEWTTLPNHDPAAAGLTTIFFVDDPGSPRDGKILDADIELNGEFFTFSAQAAGVLGTTDIENTVVHELGHVMGLDHPCDDDLRDPIPKDNKGHTIPKCFPFSALSQEMRDVTMFNFADSGETQKRTPEADDILGICETYPKNRDPGVCEPANVGGGGGGCALTKDTDEPIVPLLLLALGSLVIALRRRPDRHLVP